MTGSEHPVTRLPNDSGDLHADRIEQVDYELARGEKRCHALADVLDLHKIINTEEKRCGVEAHVTEMGAKLTLRALDCRLLQYPVPSRDPHSHRALEKNEKRPGAVGGSETS